MTLLQTMLDGAVTAAELLALLFVSPATAQEPETPGMPAALERPMQLHRLSTTADLRLLGSLADVRIAQAVRNDSPATIDLAPQLPAVDEDVDGLRDMHGTHAVDLLAAVDCGDSPAAGHARLTDDERLADAFRRAPGAGAVTEAVAARPLAGDDRRCLLLPARVEADATRAILAEQDDGYFLLLVPHRTAPRAKLVLRPRTGEAEALQLGALDNRHAIVVPLPSRAHLDDLADGAIELEIADGSAVWWSTLVAERVDGRPPMQAGATD